MSNLKLSEQQIQSLLQQDTQRHLEKLAKKIDLIYFYTVINGRKMFL